MANVPSIESKMQDTEVDFESPLSETLLTRVAGNINGLIDQTNTNESDISSIQSDITDLIDFRSVAASPTPLSVDTTIYTCPASRRAIVNPSFDNLPDVFGPPNCSLRLNKASGITIFIIGVLDDADVDVFPWKNNGGTTNGTGASKLEAESAYPIYLEAGDTLSVFRANRGAFGLDIVEYKELV